MNTMKKQLVQLLTIQAPSGQEEKVVKYAKPVLEKLADKVWLDHYGNLLAEKKVGTGQGATVILSAHMDSVRNIQKGRKVIEELGTFYSTKGVLGADDRAGMAIILAVLRNIDKTGFNGTLKIAFSREEEIGCIGSSKIDPRWIEGSDLAIVVDRRGNKDIVVGNWSQPFCSDQVGDFLENCSAMLDMDWKACEGGISDACTFAELGVNSVNLSAGYENEHTEKEFVIFKDMQKTVNLMLQALALINDFSQDFGDVPVENKWIKTYVYGSKFQEDWGWFNNRDSELWAGKETFGKVTADIIDGNVCITQKSGETTDEIYITTETFEKIATAYYAKTPILVEDDLPFANEEEIDMEEERAFIEKHGKLVQLDVK